MKYKLLKELPGLEIGLTLREEDWSKVGFSLPVKDFPDFFEPIVEKKRYEDLKEGDRYWKIGGLSSGEIFSKKHYRSETFLTREEAEDEHKRREWAVRPDRFIPKEGEEFYFPDLEGHPNYTRFQSFSLDVLRVNSGLAFRTREDCEKAIKEHDLIRLFYTVR